MRRRRHPASTVLWLLLSIGLLAACGDDDGEQPEDMHPDSGHAGEDGGGEPSLGFAAVLRDPVSDDPIEGATVKALDNDSGEPLDIDATSGANGRITFEGLPAGKVAFLAVGEPEMTIDTYQYNIDSDAQDETLWIAAKSTATAVPLLAGFEGDPEMSSVSGAVYWINGDGDEEPVGCVTVAFEGEGEASDIRYFGDNNLPTTVEMRGDTNPLNGRYFIGNAPPGVQEVSVLIDGTAMGSTTLVLFARKDASDGEDNVCISNIYVEGADENPTPADCE